MFYNTVEESTLEILKKILSLPEFKNYYLVGVTALALQLRHRLSVDLDLFGQDLLPKEKVSKNINKIAKIT